MKRCKIIIDGSNFYFKLKDLGLQKLIQADFKGFLQSLVLKKEKIVDVTYYVGQIKTDGSVKADKMHAEQKQLLAKLRRQKVKVYLGYLLKTGGKYHEKGVDVRIAVDMVVAAYEKKCDKLILLSSDTDLLPAVEIAKKRGMHIRYVGFRRQPSYALKARASSYCLLGKEQVESFVNEVGKIKDN
jgi:uncharacterized LabA/DUF88 family protein